MTTAWSGILSTKKKMKERKNNSMIEHFARVKGKEK